MTERNPKPPQADTQNHVVLEYLKSRGSISPQDAYREFGIMRLGARIHDLRALGHEITTTMRTYINDNGHAVNYASYALKKRPSPASLAREALGTTIRHHGTEYEVLGVTINALGVFLQVKNGKTEKTIRWEDIDE